MDKKRGEKFTISTSAQSESADFDWAVRLHRVILKASGIWPEIYENPWKKWLLYLFNMINILALLSSVIIPAIYGLYHSRYDLLGIIDNLQFTVPMASTLAKYLDVWAGKKALIGMIQEISDDWAKPKNPHEREMMISQAKLCRTVFTATTLLMGIPTALFLSLPLLGFKLRYNLGPNERPLVLPSRFIFDVNVSPNYELTYFAQSYAVSFAALAYTAVDNFIVLLIFHIRGQLKNLRSRILMMSRSETFQSDLIITVNDHIRLIRTIGIMDNIFTRAFGGILLYFSIIFCLYALMILYLIQMDDHIVLSRLVFIIMVLTTTFCHTALYCIMGEILVIELDQIYNAVCACEWENLKPHEARKLILIMVYTSRPVYLTAAKIIPMNITTFCKMLQMSASYISFLFAKLQ